MRKNCKKNSKKPKNREGGARIWRKNYRIWNMITIKLSKR
jgi:hypothetical protein